MALPPWQAPPAQVSPVRQAEVEQETPLWLTGLQPPPVGKQTLLEQGVPESGHCTAMPPPHAPAVQVALSVQSSTKQGWPLP